jgi:hypothetical protein
MANKESSSEDRKWHRWSRRGPGPAGGALYGMGVLGALIYFIQHASTFGDGLIGILKAIVWPALVVYKVLEMFHL